MDAVTIVSAIIVAVIAFVFGHASFLKKRDKDSLDTASSSVVEIKANLASLETRLAHLETSLSSKLAALEARTLSIPEVKALITEDTKELKGEIKALSELISKLRIDLGVLNYINNRESTRDE